MNLKTIEEDLPSSDFIRIHKSYIVSIRHITAVRGNSVFLGSKQLPVGNNYRAGLAALTGRLE
jgi:DNA-binding LytR/AlgR family response regulator